MAKSEISSNLKELHREIGEQQKTQAAPSSDAEPSSRSVKDVSTSSHTTDNGNALTIQAQTHAKARKALDQFEQHARSHPVATAVTVFGLGVLASRLFSR